MNDQQLPNSQFQAPPAPLTADELGERATKAPQKKKRRFSIIGILFRLLFAAGIIVAASYVVQTMVAARPEPVQRRAFERSFTVAVEPASFVSFTPAVRAFGDVEAANTLQVRTQAPGEIIEISPNLRPGGRVSANEVLVRIDPFDYELALANARSDAENALLSLKEAEEQLALQQDNVDFAQQQLDSAVSDLERAQTLREGGTITTQELDTRALVVTQREQTLRQSQSTLILQQSAVERQQAAIVRTNRAVAQAERSLANTVLRAPFEGIVTSATATLGAIASQGEALVSMYQADRLEVRFLISEEDFGRLSGSGLIGRDVDLTWDVASSPVKLTGEVVRIGAEIDATLGGVALYAEIDPETIGDIRPGTFVAVELEGISIDHVLVLPETALYENDHFFVVEDGRMARVAAEIVDRHGSDVIVSADIDAGAAVVHTRLAQAGDGVKVTIEGEGPAFGDEGGDNPDAGAFRPGSGGPPNGPPGGAPR